MGEIVSVLQNSQSRRGMKDSDLLPSLLSQCQYCRHCLAEDMSQSLAAETVD